MTSTPKIRIAIIGGGLAGCTLANGLMKHSHIEFTVFEAASAFKEIGAHVALGPTAQQSLELISPKLRQGLDLAGGVRVNAIQLKIGEGPHRGEISFGIGEGRASSIMVHRAYLLEQLLKDVPQERLLASKKLASIETSRNEFANLPIYKVRFVDGTSYEFDVVIGSDGIHGKVRAYVLGADSPNLEPDFAKFWVARNLISISKSKEMLKENSPDPNFPTQNCWAGDGSFMLYNLIDEGERVSLVASGITDDTVDPTSWRTPVTREFLERQYAEWGDFGKAYINCLMDQQDPSMYYVWHSKYAESYANEGIAIMGDAAHAPTPWLGSGAVMALEDAVILENLLGRADASQVSTALRAYDKVRRPRTQKVIEMSFGTGIMCCGAHPEGRLDPVKLREMMPQRWKWIWDTDVKGLVQEAVDTFAEMNKIERSART